MASPIGSGDATHSPKGYNGAHSNKAAPFFPNDDEPCLDKCRSVQHGRKIWDIAHGGSGSEIDVICLWAKTCNNYSQVKDDFGRTALHAAASSGNLKATEWLLKTQQCSINGKEIISGYSPLHRSIYFGHMAVARSLIKHGADINSRDNEGLTPLELCQKDRPIAFTQNPGDMTELTVWGSNANYNLGLGHQEPRLHPDAASEFRKPEMSLQQVEMNTYHTLFLTQNGKVYACGYGMGGRLGTGDEDTALNPSLVHLRNNGPCQAIAVGQDHSIFLTDTKVWTVGSNEYGQLGHIKLPTNKLCNPRTVDCLQRYGITGILAGAFHSVFYTSRDVLMCGLNQGQFGRGFEEMNTVPSPSKLRVTFEGAIDGEITHVAGNEFSTAVCVDQRYIYLLRRHQCTRIDSQTTTSQEIVKIQATGEKNSITLFLLTRSGRILIWRECDHKGKQSNDSKGTFTRVVFSNSRLLDVKDFTVNLSSLLIITNDGEAYKAGWNCSNPPSIVGRMEEKYGQVAAADFQIAARTRRRRDDEMPSMALEQMKMKRVPNVQTALFASSDLKGNNFAILQRHQMMDVTDVPEVQTSIFFTEIKELYLEAQEDDMVCDVIFKINNFEQYPAHRFILATVSSGFAKVFQQDDTPSPRIIKVTNQLFGVEKGKCMSLEDGKVFRAILDLIYTRSCAFLNLAYLHKMYECCRKDGIKKGNCCTEKLKEFQRFRALVRTLGLNESYLHLMDRFLTEFDIYWEPILVRNEKINEILCDYSFSFDGLSFNRVEGNQFSDVILESRDKVEFEAHKCILVARLNYFKSLFSMNWIPYGLNDGQGHQKKNPHVMLPFSSKAISMLLECIYTNAALSLKDADCELIGETLACSDYLMNDKLLQQSELEMSKNLSLKNVADILSFSWKHNGHQIKNTCFDFISLNLTAMLENRLLDNLQLDIIQELSSYYRAAQRRNLSINRHLTQCGGTPLLDAYEMAVKQTSEDTLETMENILDEDRGVMLMKKSTNKPARTRVRLRSRTLSESESVHETEESTLTRQVSNMKLNVSGTFEEEYDKTPVGSPIRREITPPVTPAIPERKLVVPLPQNISPKLTPKKSDHYLKDFPTLGASSLICGSPPNQAVKTISFDTAPHTPTLIAKSNTATPPAAKAVGAASRTSPWNTPTFKSSTCSQNSLPGTSPKASSFGSASKQPGTSITFAQKDLPKLGATAGGNGKKKTKWRTISSESDIQASSANANVGATQQQSQLTSDGRDRNNPWKVKDTTSQVAFTAIVEDEVEKKRNFEKATSKPLPMMQIEDEAINWLTEHYTSEDTADHIEILTVERVVTSNFSTPTWVQHPGAVTAPQSNSTNTKN